MITALKLNKIYSADRDRLSRYFQFLFRRAFRRLLTDPSLLRKMKNYPLHEMHSFDLYGNVFIQITKQINDYRIERYQIYVFDEKRDILFKCILMLKTDGTIWIDVVSIRNRYYCSNFNYRVESTSPKEIYNDIVKKLLTWS